MNAASDKREERIPGRALRALAELEGSGPNPLSPLTDLDAPGGPADREEMAAWLEGLEGPWEWAGAALAGPQWTVGLLYADQEGVTSGQYAFPDAAGAGPSFNVTPEADGLALSGPWSAGEVRVAVLGRFSLEAVADMPQAYLDLSPRLFLGLAAFVDAYRAAALAREMARAAGLPEGLSVPEVMEAWSSGLGRPNPQWAVAMLSLLDAGGTPAGFEREMPAVMLELTGAGLLERVDLGGKQAYYAPRGALERLCREAARSCACFGLVSRRLDGAGRVELSSLIGWRTGEGIWLAGLGGEEARVLMQVGPYAFMEYVTGLLRGGGEEAPGGGLPPDAPLARDALVSRLRSVPVSQASAPSFCDACGSPLRPGKTFCSGCGKPVREAAPPRAACAACGHPLSEGQNFCRKCGLKV